MEKFGKRVPMEAFLTLLYVSMQLPLLLAYSDVRAVILKLIEGIFNSSFRIRFIAKKDFTPTRNLLYIPHFHSNRTFLEIKLLVY